MQNTRRNVYDYVIYHRGCPDGFTGFVFAKTSGALRENFTVYPDVPYAKNAPKKVGGKSVLIIDVAYNDNILKSIIDRAKFVTVIDHHTATLKASKAWNKNNKNWELIYDVTKCGASLSWETFYPRVNLPLYVKYIQDNDLGLWHDPNTRHFMVSLKTLYQIGPNEELVDKWMDLMEPKRVHQMVEEGTIMSKYIDQTNKINIKYHCMAYFPSKILYKKNPNVFDKPKQYKVAMFSGMFSSPDFTQKALQTINCDIVVLWSYNLIRKNYVFTMRSLNYDVSKIAEGFGGGGHRLAASFSFYKNEMDIDDLIEHI